MIISVRRKGQGAMGMFTLQDGFLFQGPQLCVPSSPLHTQIIRERNFGGLGSYFGVAKTLQLL